jgi:hypothetical protein
MHTDLRHLSQLCATYLIRVMKKLQLSVRTHWQSCSVRTVILWCAASAIHRVQGLWQHFVDGVLGGMGHLLSAPWPCLMWLYSTVATEEIQDWASCLLNRFHVTVTDCLVAAGMMWVSRGLVYCYLFGWTYVLRWWLQDTLLHHSDIMALWKIGVKAEVSALVGVWILIGQFLLLSWFVSLLLFYLSLSFLKWWMEKQVLFASHVYVWSSKACIHMHWYGLMLNCCAAGCNCYTW